MSHFINYQVSRNGHLVDIFLQLNYNALLRNEWKSLPNQLENKLNKLDKTT